MVATLGLAGCGDDDDAASTTDAAVTLSTEVTEDPRATEVTAASVVDAASSSSPQPASPRVATIATDAANRRVRGERRMATLLPCERGDGTRGAVLERHAGA
jgi:hypothetical protein